MPAKMKTTSNSKDKSCPPSLVQAFFAEILQISGKSHHEISELLDTGKAATLDTAKISQYLNGHQPLSLKRLLQLAKRAKELKWDSPSVQMLLNLDEWGLLEKLEEHSNSEEKINKKLDRSEKASVVALEKAIKGLVECEWDAHDIVCAVILLTQKFIPEEKLNGGGIVNLARMAKILRCDFTKLPEVMWLEWSFHIFGKSLDDDAAGNGAIESKPSKIKESIKPVSKPTQKSPSKSKAAKKSPAKRSSSK
jgi:hypothetical protein